jgi:hypothetical protein
MTRSAIGSVTGVDSDSFYDCKSGITISVILALSLAWIPYIGPIVAGFVGGRRAGSLLRGLFVGILSSLVVFGVTFLLGLGLIKLFEPGYQSFIDKLEGIEPFLVDLLRMFKEYLSGNFVMVAPDKTIDLVFHTFVSIIGFSIIGGVFADQARRELRIVVSQSINANKPKPRRSTSAFLDGRERGFQTYSEMCKMSVSAISASIEAEMSDKGTNPVPVQIVPEPVDMGLITSETSNLTQAVHESEPVEGEESADTVKREVSKIIKPDAVKRVVPEGTKPKANATTHKISNMVDDLEWL